MAVGQASYLSIKEYKERIESAKQEARSFSTDYLEGYLKGYESRNSLINRFLVKMFIRLKPPEVVAYRHVLSKRKELSDKL